MEKKDLVSLARQISNDKYETQTIEVKAAKVDTPKRLFDTLSSFSNQDSGGIIVFGIDEEDDFKICGVYSAQDLQKRIAEQCEQMQPVCRPLLTVADVDGNAVVSAEIPPIDFADRPCFYKGRGILKGSYVRVGDSDMPMTAYEVYRYESYRKQERSDLRLLPNMDLSCLNEPDVENFIKLAKIQKPNLAVNDDSKILELLGVSEKGQATLTGWLLFNDYPQSLFPQLCVTAVVVPGVEMGDSSEEGLRFIDNGRFEGKLSDVLSSAEKFVIRNMKDSTIIGGDLKRADRYEYPPVAIREIVLNALMHRDYSSHSDSIPVSIVMYKDRIEVVNPGGLYGRITVDNLGKIRAEVRNTILVGALEILRIAENRHSGIPTIRMEMEKYGLPQPIFEDYRGEFKVTLYNSHRDILDFCRAPKTRAEIAAFAGVTQDWAMEKIIKPNLNVGKLKMTLPEKPKSKLQKYDSS